MDGKGKAEDLIGKLLQDPELLKSLAAAPTGSALRALAEDFVPGTIGFRNPDPAAVGIVHPEPVRLRGRHLLLTNSGFGGVNGVLVLGGSPQ